MKIHHAVFGRASDLTEPLVAPTSASTTTSTLSMPADGALYDELGGMIDDLKAALLTVVHAEKLQLRNKIESLEDGIQVCMCLSRIDISYCSIKMSFPVYSCSARKMRICGNTRRRRLLMVGRRGEVSLRGRRQPWRCSILTTICELL